MAAEAVGDDAEPFLSWNWRDVSMNGVFITLSYVSDIGGGAD
jgi:hypothetical protein